MDAEALDRAKDRIESAAAGRIAAADVAAALERAREQIESLAQTASTLEASLPERIGSAVQEGMRQQVAPAGRQLAEVRGLLHQLLRRLERLEGDLLAERHARVDDLSLLVDLISSGWTGVDGRLGRLETAVAQRDGATVYRIDDRRHEPAADAGS